MGRLAAAVLGACLAVGIGGTARAQEITGSISGSVLDKSGGAVVSATVTIQNADKNDVVIRVLTTNSSGQFVGPYLPIGRYTLRAEAPGFKTTERRGITLNVNDHLTVDLTLEPGTVSEKVTVEADVSPVELETATASGLITGMEIRELALNTRNYEQLVALTPGVSTGLPPTSCTWASPTQRGYPTRSIFP